MGTPEGTCPALPHGSGGLLVGLFDSGLGGLTVLRRVHQGTTHEVTVALDGFDYAGRRFKTLSAIAKLITGTPWNGFAFFGLKAPPADEATTESTAETETAA